MILKIILYRCPRQTFKCACGTLSDIVSILFFFQRTIECTWLKYYCL